MLIRCKLFRVGGSKVELGKGKTRRQYHFKPREAAGLKGPELDAVMNDQDLDHVCDVAEKEDIATFLAIPEGYEVHDSAIASPAAKAAKRVAKKAKPAAKNGAKAKPAGNYAHMRKPDLIKRIVEHPNFKGKAPHGTTPTSKLVEQLEALDGKPQTAE
jgi:hypothetical protein